MQVPFRRAVRLTLVTAAAACIAVGVFSPPVCRGADNYDDVRRVEFLCGELQPL